MSGFTGAMVIVMVVGGVDGVCGGGLLASLREGRGCQCSGWVAAGGLSLNSSDPLRHWLPTTRRFNRSVS